MNDSSYRIVELDVVRWGEAKGILFNSDPKTQCLKFASEAGELCDAVAKGNREDTVDAIGDVMVTLILLSTMLDLDVVQCLNSAYRTISKRTGSMHNGVFIKN